MTKAVSASGVVERSALRLRGGEAQLRYLSQSIRMEEAVTPQIVRATMLLVAAAIVGFASWAATTTVSEVAKATGDVRPSGHVQVVQHLEGGIIEQINVREGDLVVPGQVLLQIGDTAAEKDLSQLRSKQLFLDLQAERLRAFLEHREPDFATITKRLPELVAEQDAVFRGMRNAFESERMIIENQALQKRQLLSMLTTRSETLERNRTITERLRDTKKGLYDRGLATLYAFLDAEQRLISVAGEEDELRIRISEAEQQIAEYESRMQALDATYRDRAYQELNRIEDEARQNREALAKPQDRVERLAVRSPGRGYVKGLQTHTVGEVIGPGETLMEIVPVDQQLVAEVKISPKDIGHVSVGQTVRVKLSSYDFARYGAIEGTLESISATTFVDELGDSYYVGRVPLKSSHIGANPAENRILPGMTLEADIVTGGKTILSYLLKPIHTSLNSALTER